MAATNPLRVSDLIKKYGWAIMPYLSNLGSRNLAEAQVLFVDSGHTNASDADDGEHGHSFTRPLATIDYAVGLSTASEGSIILAAPGHAETQSASGVCITADIAGVSIICLGEGTLRPTITLSTDTGAVALSVTAANVSVQNLRVLVTMDAVVKAINIAASDCKLVDVEIQDNANSTEAAIGILTTTAADRLYIERFKHNGFLDGDACTQSISLVGVDRGVIKDCWFRGKFSTAAVQMVTTACSGIIIDRCVFENGTTALTKDVVDNASSKWSALRCWDAVGGYSFSGGDAAALAADDISSVSTALSTGTTTLAGIQLDHLAQTASAGSNYPSEVVTNTILGMIMSDNGNVDQFNKANHSLKAIRDAVDGIGSPTDVTGAVPDTPTAKSLQDILSKADGANTYDNTTDSLEAIRDHLDGATVLAGIQLDTLAGVDTGVAIDGDLEAHCVAGSLLAHVLSKTKDATTFNCSTDSLEAIADAVAAITFTAAVSQNPTARSLQDILEKDNTGSFDDATDSLEAIRDHLDGTTILSGIQLDHLAQTASAGTNYPTEITTDSILGMIMSANGNPSGFNKTTDSLQAIRDHLDGTTALAGIALDNLILTSDGDQAYPASLGDHSVLAAVMTSNGVASGYDRATDSLEAIRDHLDGATVLAGIQLDTLAGVDTGVAVDGDLEAHCVAGSLLAHVLSKSKDATDYKCSTDSLQAISDKTGGFTGDGGTDYNDSVYAALIKMSTYLIDGDGDFATGQALPSNTSLVDIIGDFTGPHDGAAYDDNIFSCLKKISTYICDGDGDFATGTALPANKSIYDITGAYTADGDNDDEDTIMAHLDLIYADSAALDNLKENAVTKTVTNLSAASGDTNIFTVSGGPVKVTSIMGIVANTIKNATINCKLIAVPTTPGNDVDITNVVDIDTAAAGSALTPGATLGAALVLTANGAVSDMGFDFVMDEGNIQMNLSANGDADDSIEWYIRYVPLVSGAAIAAAA